MILVSGVEYIRSKYSVTTFAALVQGVRKAIGLPHVEAEFVAVAKRPDLGVIFEAGDPFWKLTKAEATHHAPVRLRCRNICVFVKLVCKTPAATQYFEVRA